MVLYGNQTRYWYTLLPAIIANLELYPGWSIRLHVAKDVYQHPVCGLLSELENQLNGRFAVHKIDKDYVDQEPSMWRMLPLWDSSVSKFMCRDVDSVPSTSEIQAVRIWCNTKYAIQSIRSYHLHTTLLMAGLCSFNNDELRVFRNVVSSFDDYVGIYKKYAVGSKNFQWGCDQEILKMAFGGCLGMILDFPLGDCPYHITSQIAFVEKERVKAESVADLSQPLLALCDEITKIPWGEFEGFAGRPHGDFRPYMARMLDIPLNTCQIVKRILEQNKPFKDFYEPNANK